MTDKLHPADAADIEKIATATHFTVHLRAGPHDKVTKRAKTLAAAIRAADAMGKTPGGRKPLIYAITPDNFTVMVPADMIAEARKDAAEPELTAKQVAILTSIVTGGGFKRSNSKAAAEARFIKVATEAGIKNAADIVRGPFDMAEHVIREHLAGYALTIAEVKAMPVPKARDGVAPAKVGDYPAPAATKTAGERLIKAAKEMRSAVARKPTGKRAAILEAAQRGKIPAAPDFSAPTHARFRKKLAEIVAMVEAGDIAGLKAMTINPVSSSPKAMAKYRDLAVIAIEARQQKDAA